MDHQNAYGGRKFPENRPQAERALGRGLEDISHLFLSQAVSEPNAGSEAQRSVVQPVKVQQPAPAFVTALSPLEGVSREQLISLLKGRPMLLEDGLRIIDASIPVYPCGPIDLLAVDDGSRLIVVDIDPTC